MPCLPLYLPPFSVFTPGCACLPSLVPGKEATSCRADLGKMLKNPSANLELNLLLLLTGPRWKPDKLKLCLEEREGKGSGVGVTSNSKWQQQIKLRQQK